MPHELPPLPYALNALEPHISAETLEYHYGKHHNTYVEKLNGLLVEETEAEMSLPSIIVKAPPGSALFNNAAQVWNHTFYWNCLTPNSRQAPDGELSDALSAEFGSVEDFKRQFNEQAASLFGSGWVWLVKKNDGSLAIEPLSNAANPLTEEQVPLLTCDVWEHAYYIDYRNARANYLEAFWNLVNWDQVAENFTRFEALKFSS